MLGFSQKEKEDIVRNYFGPEGAEEDPRCLHCGEILGFHLFYNEGELALKVSCPGCANGFTWTQDRPVTAWKPLHLDYFLERYESEEAIRCPLDDSFVICVEYSAGLLDFRCPFCNRRGRVRRPIDETKRPAAMPGIQTIGSSPESENPPE